MFYVLALAAAGSAVALPFLGLAKLTEWTHRRCHPYDY
ncbi:hypothetical protein SAMN04488144_103299 [Methylobacterium sp. 190mf]|nr:hypothetical protein SAMN04488144_103299 [Methylobacterium sp. 190mf]